MDQNIIKYGSIIVSSLTVLSYLLSINEYYENKAYWDYFHINDRIRTNMRSGFHAEYLSYALVIICFFLIIDGFLVYFQEQVKNTFLFLLYYSTICIALFAVVLISLYFIVWKFNLTDVNERRVWEDRKRYLQFVKKAYRLSLLRLIVPYLLSVISLYYYSVKRAYLISAFLFIVAYIYLQFQNYSHRQQMINDTKWFNITIIGSESYVLLACNGDLIQMNSCSLYKGVLYISLDKVLIRNMNGVIYQTMYINKFEKICNGAICTEHYKARYRDGFN